MLVEMSGRIASISRQTIAAAVRERFGFHFQSVPLSAELLTDVLLLAAEVGGVGIALRLLTGIGFQWWIPPVAAVAWLILWFGNFTAIEDGLGLLGLVTLSFVVAPWRLHADPAALGRGLMPSVPSHDGVRYAFLAVSILGATVSPYLLNFYASGAVEEKWSAEDLWINRATAFVGMGFGTIVSMGVLVTARAHAGAAAHPRRFVRAGGADVRAGVRALGRDAVRAGARRRLSRRGGGDRAQCRLPAGAGVQLDLGRGEEAARHGTLQRRLHRRADPRRRRGADRFRSAAHHAGVAGHDRDHHAAGRAAVSRADERPALRQGTHQRPDRQRRARGSRHPRRLFAVVVVPLEIFGG